MPRSPGWSGCWASRSGPAGLLAALARARPRRARGVVVQRGAVGRRMGPARWLPGTLAAALRRHRRRGRRPGARRGEPAAAPQSASAARIEPFTQAGSTSWSPPAPGVRQHDGGVVHHLPRQRARGAAQRGGAGALRRQGRRLPQGRLDHAATPRSPRLLEKHGRSGVPLYLLYAGGGEPIVLPQILTPATVLGEIDRIPDPPQRQASLSTSAKE